MSTAKEHFKALPEAQPEDSSSEELIRELALLVMVQRGLADSDAGRAVSNASHSLLVKMAAHSSWARGVVLCVFSMLILMGCGTSTVVVAIYSDDAAKVGAGPIVSLRVPEESKNLVVKGQAGLSALEVKFGKNLERAVAYELRKLFREVRIAGKDQDAEKKPELMMTVEITEADVSPGLTVVSDSSASVTLSAEFGRPGSPIVERVLGVGKSSASPDIKIPISENYDNYLAAIRTASMSAMRSALDDLIENVANNMR